jgi:FtsP/CotA-like multicopper oxidase with cupredoxin domain
VEIVVTFRPGERVVLRSFPPDMGIGSIGDRFVGGADTLDIVELRAAARLKPSPQVPATLVPVPTLNASDPLRQRDFRLSGREVNGKRMDPHRIDVTVAKGSVENWRVANRDGTPHTFHVHGVSFQVLSVAGAAPPGELSGWKDTIYLSPNVVYSLIIRFPEYTDPTVPYMFHCHVLLHEDEDMMAQFAVVEPGKSEPGKSEPGKSEPGQIEPGRSSTHHHGG